MKFSSFPKLYQIGIRFPKTVLVLFILLTVASFIGVKKLKIESNLTALLPRNLESVRAMEESKKYFGGLGYLFVTVEARDAAEAQAFADVLAPRIEALPLVRYVEYRNPIDFFLKRLWLYLEDQDLAEMERRLDLSIELQKKGVSPVFRDLNFFAEEEDRPDLTFSDIREKYEKRAGMEIRDRVSGDGGRFLVLRVVSGIHQQNLDQSRRLIEGIGNSVGLLKGQGHYDSVKVNYTGGLQKVTEEVNYIWKEITRVSIIVTLALFLILFFYFRSFSATFLVGLPLTGGVLWTGGLVYLILGHLNIMTGFGAAILAGLGSDYGIYLLTRYYHERAEGHPFQKACDLAFGGTGRATHASMMTTVGSFVALLFSSFGVFFEFGVVGAVGLIANYVAMMLLVPSLLVLYEPWRGRKRTPILNRFRENAIGRGVTRSSLFRKVFTVRGTLSGIIAAVLLMIAGLLSLPYTSGIQFEDGRLDAGAYQGRELYAKVREVVNVNLSPTVLIVKGAENEKRTVNALLKHLKSERPEDLVYQNAVGLSRFVPGSDQEQMKKKEILKRILAKFQKVRIPRGDEVRLLWDGLRASIEAPPVTRENLPIEIRRRFESQVDSNVFAVYVYPSVGRETSDEMLKYRNGLFSIFQKENLPVSAVDTTFIANDTVRMIGREAPRGLALILLFFAIVLFVMVRPPKRALLILVNLVGSLLLLAGLLRICGIHLNIINIAIFPIVLGTGIDCFIHFSHHYDESRSLEEGLRHEVPAMFISSLTSIVGFGGFILTSSAGIRSVGWVSVLGLMIVTLLAAFLFPRCLALMEQHAYPKSVPNPS